MPHPCTHATPLCSQGVRGFLPKKDAAALGRPLAPGSLVEVVVGGGGLRPGGGAAGTVTVSASPEAVAAAAPTEWEGLNIGSLLPGQLVTARVRNVLSDGLLCSFLTYFSGTVDPFHLGTDLAADWRKLFRCRGAAGGAVAAMWWCCGPPLQSCPPPAPTHLPACALLRPAAPTSACVPGCCLLTPPSSGWA